MKVHELMDPKSTKIQETGGRHVLLERLGWVMTALGVGYATLEQQYT